MGEEWWALLPPVVLLVFSSIKGSRVSWVIFAVRPRLSTHVFLFDKGGFASVLAYVSFNKKREGN